MAQAFPCINPVCDYSFSLAEIKGAAALACPRCGNVFQLGAGTGPVASTPSPATAPPQETPFAIPAPPAAPKPPMATPVAAKPPLSPPVLARPPMATPVSPPLPVATPVILPAARPADMPAPPVAKLVPKEEPRFAYPPPSASMLFTPEEAATLSLVPTPVSPPIAARVTPPDAAKLPPLPTETNEKADESFTFAGESAITASAPRVESGTALLDAPPPAAGATGKMVSTSTLPPRSHPPLALPQRILLISALSLLLIGLPLMAMLLLFGFLKPGGDDGYAEIYNGKFFNLQRTAEPAFRLALPFDTWKENKGFRDLLNAAVALEAEAIDEASGQKVTLLLAVAGQDYGKVKPRDAELLKQAVARLEKCFPGRVSIETTPEFTKLDGERALALYFQGELNSVDWVGKCYAMTHHGFGYWVFLAQTIPINADQELAEKMLTHLQQDKKMGFRFITKRQGWTEQQPELVAFMGNKAPVKIRAAKGVWDEFPAKDVDAQGEIYLHSKDKRKYHKEHEKEATILVLKVKKETPDLDAALKAAEEYVAAKKKDENGAFLVTPLDKMADAKDKMPKDKDKMPEDEPAPNPKKPIPMVGNRPGKIREFQMESDDKDYKKYILVGVVQEKEHYYLIQCESFWQYRQAWRGDFLDILDTFSVSKAE